MKSLVYKFLGILILTYFVYYVCGTLSKQTKKKNDKTKKFKGTKTNVISRGLVSENVKVVDILENYKKFCEPEKNLRQFTTNQVLAYVTPWNAHGYDVAKSFGKFSMISPVWLQIKRKPRGKYLVTGMHDIDKGWMKDARKINQDVQILPRMLFDGWSVGDYKALFSSEDEIEEMIETISKVLLENGMDGAVIEIWSQLPKKKAKEAIHVLTHLGETFREKELTFVLVIPPAINFEGKASGFTYEHFQQLVPLVDAFSLMTYDFGAGSGKAGPTAPTWWVKSCVEHLDPERKDRSKILLGLNFYGFAYSHQGASAVTGNQYIDLLQSYPSSFEWDSTSEEHFVWQNITAGQRSLIVYPSLKSIHTRVELARSLGTGISIWEIGQGLDYFYDLL